MLRSSEKQIHANNTIIAKSNTSDLQTDDFSAFNHLYQIHRHPNTKKWIGFQPQNNKIIKKVSENNGNSTLGYKIHIVIPKDADYKKHLDKVIEILGIYGLYFKIDAYLNKEISGERAFTVYLPHQIHAHWFEALKLIDTYLTSQLANQSKPTEYSSDATAKLVTGFKHIRYRNDKGPDGSYNRKPFDNACERSLINPFRPSAVSLLHEIYAYDIQLYKRIADQIQNDIGYCEFLIKLHHRNKLNFLNLAKTLADNPQLHRIVSNLSWYHLANKQNENFPLAEALVKKPNQFRTMLSALTNKSACPAYHAASDALKKHNEQYPNASISLKREKNNIGKAIEAITVKSLYSKLFEKEQYSKHIATQEISDEIDARLVHNDNLTVDKSTAKCIGITLLNIFHMVPIIGWSVGSYHYLTTGSFFHSYGKKLKPHKEVEHDLISAINSNSVLNLK